MFCDWCGMEIQEGTRFCPNCGNKVAQILMPVTEQVPVFASEQRPTKKRKWFVYGGIGAAILLLLAVAVFMVYGLVLGKGGRVMAAINATAKEAPLLVEDLQDIQKILSGDQYLVGIEADVENGLVKGEFRNASKDKQIYLSANIGEYDNLALLCGVHSGVFRASAEGLDYAFFYDPKQDNEGFLSEDFREKELERVNSLLESITSDQLSAAAIRKNSVSALEKEFKNLEFDNAETRQWMVNGKERNCKGYRVALDEENIVHFWEAFSEYTQKKMRSDTKAAVDDVLDIIIDEVKDTRFDADISFYLYRGKLAAVVIEVADQNIRIEFRGGDYRMQNMVVVIENKYFSEELTISSERKGKTETTTIKAGDGKITIVYNAKSGEVSLEGEIYGKRCSIEGIYRHSGFEVSYKLEDIVIGGHSLPGNAGFTVYAKKDPGIEKYKGEKFDLGNASREDFEELAEDLEEYIDAANNLLW